MRCDPSAVGNGALENDCPKDISSRRLEVFEERSLSTKGVDCRLLRSRQEFEH